MVTRIIDLTMHVEEGMQTFPSHCHPEHTDPSHADYAFVKEFPTWGFLKFKVIN